MFLFFTWTGALGKIPTLDNLQSRNIIVVDWSCICKNDGFYIVILMSSILELLECWQGNFGKHMNFLIWRVIPHCLMWSIWQEHNGRSFEDCEQSYVEIKLFFLRSLCELVDGLGSHSCSSLLQFLELCTLRVP